MPSTYRVVLLQSMQTEEQTDVEGPVAQLPVSEVATMCGSTYDRVNRRMMRSVIGLHRNIRQTPSAIALRQLLHLSLSDAPPDGRGPATRKEGSRSGRSAVQSIGSLDLALDGAYM